MTIPISHHLMSLASSATTVVTYLIVRKVMEVASRSFVWLKDYFQFIAFVATAALSTFLTVRLAPILLGANLVLHGQAIIANAIALIVIGVIDVFEVEEKPQAKPPVEISFGTNMMAPAKVASYAVLPGRDEILRTIERCLNRPKGTQSVVLIGEESSQPELIVEECARRIAQNALPPGSPLLNKKLYFIAANDLSATSVTDLKRELDTLSGNGGAILVMNQIDVLNDKVFQWTCGILENHIKSGQISVIGMTTPGNYEKVQSLSFASNLTPIQVPPTEAQHCFAAMQAKNRRGDFTQRFPNITVSPEALALATLFSYHHVFKGFVLKDVAILLSDMLFEIGNPAQPYVLTKELFLQHWKASYQKDPTKISLASIDPDSKAFFAQKGINVDQYIAMVIEMNKAKANDRLGKTDMPRFLRDMNIEAREGEYPVTVGRDEEIGAVVRSLRQSKNKSVVLLGQPGIGKTAIFEEIARRIVTGDPTVAALKDKTLYWVDVTALSGTEGWVGLLQKKVSALIEFSRQQGGNAFFVIDELHQLRGAGRYHGNDTDVFEMIKNSLARDEIVVLGTANDYLWDPIVQKDPAIQRRIKSIHVQPPSASVCVRMLNHTNSTGFYTKGYDPAYVQVTSEAVMTAVYLTEEWMKKRFLPDKATVLITETVGFFQAQEEKARASNVNGAHQPKKQIIPLDIARRLYHSIRHEDGVKNMTEGQFLFQALQPDQYRVEPVEEKTKP